MRVDPAATPFVVGAVVPALILVGLGWGLWAVPFAGLAAFFLFFFRDPPRASPADADAVLAPADGRVLVAGAPEPATAPAGRWLQVSIFLSPVDVHVNRTPVAGRVVRVDYHPGRFLPAYRSEAATDNERNEIWLDHDGQTVVCRQVVGLLARRVVCRVEPGAALAAGERLGIMKFGSRMDVFLPVTATLLVTVGQTVRGGETVIGRLASRASAAEGSD